VQPEAHHRTVPKQRAKVEEWEKRLRDAVRAQHPFGYSIRSMNGRIQVQRYWKDTGKRETATLPLEWHQGSQRELLNALDAINKVLNRGMSLRHAVRLVFDLSEGPSVRVNWSEVLDRFRRHKIVEGAVKESTWRKEYEPRLQWLVEQLNTPSGPNDGTKALEAMAKAANPEPVAASCACSTPHRCCVLQSIKSDSISGGCQATLKTEPLPTPKTEPPRGCFGARSSGWFRPVGGDAFCCSWVP